MQQYEICFIAREEKSAETVKKNFGSLGAKILYEQKIGRKKFAYPLKKEAIGFYWSIYFELGGVKINELIKNIKMESSILRFMVVKNEQDIKKLIEREKIKPTKTEEPAKKVEPQIIKKEVQTIPTKILKTKGKTTTPKVKEAKVQKVTSKTPEIKPEPIKKTPEDKEEVSRIKKPHVDKMAAEDEAERIKKLEEKLDELLKE